MGSGWVAKSKHEAAMAQLETMVARIGHGNQTMLRKMGAALLRTSTCLTNVEKPYVCCKTMMLSERDSHQTGTMDAKHPPDLPSLKGTDEEGNARKHHPPTTCAKSEKRSGLKSSFAGGNEKTVLRRRSKASRDAQHNTYRVHNDIMPPTAINLNDWPC